MNQNLLQYYICEYKENFKLLNKWELYKWEAVKCFQDHWNESVAEIEFAQMLSLSIGKTKNLLGSGQYFPARMLNHYAEINPKKTKCLFAELFDEQQDLYQRIENFRKGTSEIHNSVSYLAGRATYQDDRAIIVYLTLRYPETYFLYKFEMFRQFSAKVKADYTPQKGRIENIGHYLKICSQIRHELSKDQDLLKLHKERIGKNCYYDEKFNLLTQDFIYAVSKHLNTLPPPELNSAPKKKGVVLSVTEIRADEIPVGLSALPSLNGKKTNHIKNHIENARIGLLGEQLILRHERELLKTAGHISPMVTIRHSSVEEGDGTGYDIYIRNADGTEKFIEVKTTPGKKNVPFYVTSAELYKSKIEQNNYHLYRLFNYDEKADTADLLVITGDLSNLCTTPVSYKISLA